ncbi:MAG: hypothetical protein AAB091_00725, partial [Elusimicrobiota bacterium]
MITLGDSPLFSDCRARAGQAWERLVWPNPKSEAWRRSDLDFLKLPQEPVRQWADWNLVSRAEGALMPLGEGLGRWGPAVARYFMEGVRPEDGKFQAQHYRFLGDGVCVYLPPGRLIEEPLRMARRLAHAGAYYPHTLIVLDEGAAATVIAQESSAEDSIFVNAATEIFLGAGARLSLAVI